MTFRYSVVLGAMVLLALVGGCDPTDDQIGGDPIEGTFTVRLIDGARVPTLDSLDQALYPGCVEIATGGRLILHASGRFNAVLGERETFCGGTHEGSSAEFGGVGSYTRNGNEVTFAPATGAQPLIAAYSPDGGGEQGEVGAPPTSIPAFTLTLNGRTYLVVQDELEVLY